jgi:putative membrane protein
MDNESLERLKPANPSDALTRERNREAAERTLLAWIRTCLSLIAFGFGIFKIVQILSGGSSQGHPMTVILGLSFLLLGCFAMVAATIEHLDILKRLRLEGDPYTPRHSLGTVVSIVLILIGLFALISVMVEHFSLDK